MLDVHPPHHAASTWRDFFIHIATIVVGLLIAVGLEQVVERVHQHYELIDTRAAIEREQHSNDKVYAEDEYDWRRTFVELKNNLMVLNYVRHHPGTPQKALPGVLSWMQSPFKWNHAVWDAALQKGIVQLMPLQESNLDQEYYGILSAMSEQSLQTWNIINEARAFDLVEPDPTRLSPEQLNRVIQLTTAALEKHVLHGYTFGRFAHEYPERPHTITWDLIATLRPSDSSTPLPGMAAAHQRTTERLNAANSGADGATIDPRALQ